MLERKCARTERRISAVRSPREDKMQDKTLIGPPKIDGKDSKVDTAGVGSKEVRGKIPERTAKTSVEGENELVAYSMRSMSSESGVLEQRSVETGSGISEPGVSMELSNYLDSALPECCPSRRNSLFVSLGDVNYETDEARIKAYMISGMRSFDCCLEH